MKEAVKHETSGSVVIEDKSEGDKLEGPRSVMQEESAAYDSRNNGYVESVVGS